VAVVEAYRARENVPGVAIVAMRGDSVVFSRAFGSGRGKAASGISVRSRQPFYSIGKQMTAALILRLAAEGRIDLDAPVGRYLPEWFADEPRLRVRHLLRHVSGLAEFTNRDDVKAIERAAPGTSSLAAMAPIIDGQKRRYAPGERHSYSNSNYTLLALIAERAGGRPFEQLLRGRLFEPLGLAGMESCAALPAEALTPGHDSSGAAVGLPPNPGPSFDGNGGVCGDAVSLARWTRALGAGRVVNGPWLAAMRRGEMVEAGYRPPYGFGLSTVTVAGRPAFSHAGVDNGWGAWAAYLPDEELTVVLLADRGWLWATDMGVPVTRALLGDPEPPPPSRRPLGRKEREALTGGFEDGLFDIAIAAESDRILVTVPPFGDPIELWKQSDGSFVSPRRPDTFRLRRAGGRIEFDWMEHRSYLVRRADRGTSQ
jgi:CubicO group peptidase (beta-lactamase class C family)